jgi:hypothetical protein
MRERPRVTGLRLRDGQELNFECVIDASGRRTRAPEWLRTAGLPAPSEQSQDAGMIYYSRYFRFHPGVKVATGNGIRSGPSGNFPLVSLRVNTTDRDTFSVLTAVASWEKRFRSLKDEAVFNAFASRLPGVAAWIDPSVSAPICKVHAFGDIHDRYWNFLDEGRPIVQDLYPVGDARVHTSPFFGWGITLALNHAYMLADSFQGPGREDNQIAFEERAGRFSLGYYEAAAGEDAARSALWQGDKLNDADSWGFYVSTLQPASSRDPYVYRAVYRRVNLLDGINAIFSDDEILARARAAIAPGGHRGLSAMDLLSLFAEAEKYGTRRRSERIPALSGEIAPVISTS